MTSSDSDNSDLGQLLTPEAPATLPEATRRAIYEVIALRRDVRHFQPGRAVDEATLTRILEAAHLAPSVGFSQPWHFIVVRDPIIRQRVRQSFLTCREREATRFPPQRRAEYLRHKLEGIEEAPLNLCVAVDLRDQGEAILGTTVQPEAVRASACCAVQNLWLAARAEGIGVGWVSIVEPAVLRAELQLPAGVEPLAYLCVGHPVAFRRRPMLDETGWAARRPLAEAMHRDRFSSVASPPAAVAPAAPAPAPQIFPAMPTFSSYVVPAFDLGAAQASRAHQASLVKPTGSLGRLEDLAAAYAGARGVFPTDIPARPSLALFAADHGVAAEGVSAYGSQSTAAMIGAVMAGGAAVNVLARQHDIDLTLVDVGVAGDLSAVPRQPVTPLLRRSLGAGSRNFRLQPALEPAQVTQALAVGAQIANQLIDAGATLLGVGEIGIGNTTSAAALISVLTQVPPGEITGRGTGLDDAGVLHKTRVITDAIGLHRPDRGDPLAVLAALGGLEIAAMVGFVIAGPQRRVPVVLDGFVTNAAALVACALAPGIRPYLLASHHSAERGAQHVLAALSLPPLLDLGLRLGEGTGAILAMDLVRTAVAAQRTMASFATAGIVRPG